jgi:UDP-N-acetylmuramoylalanine--D-glutamate ligase
LKRDDVPCINLGSDITMRDIVATAAEHADAGDVVILSPACASFGMFQNYTDRGQQFIDAVESLDR